MRDGQRCGAVQALDAAGGRQAAGETSLTLIDGHVHRCETTVAMATVTAAAHARTRQRRREPPGQQIDDAGPYEKLADAKAVSSEGDTSFHKSVPCTSNQNPSHEQSAVL